MKKSNINSILKQVLEKVIPSDEELEKIDNDLKIFLRKIEKKIKKLNLKVEIFIGGSFAKKTVIKREEYDVDIFLRFDKKYENISELTEKILSEIKKRKIHGSRDYFEIKTKKNVFFEVIPVRKIKNPREAENITDLSYSHVNYIRKITKSKNLSNEIKLAKSFCHANGFYGAESYIKGFSGYALELLIGYYGSFLRFIKETQKHKYKDKIIIDLKKHFKNKSEILMDLNASKLQSPIILIDPTYKQRNALAALSEETFTKFKGICKKFLKNPSVKFFEVRQLDINKIKKDAKRKKLEFIYLELKTNKQKGDIAGSKLLKFYNHIGKEIIGFFYIKNKGFEYKGNKSAECFFVVKRKNEILYKGPNIKQEKNVKAFKKVHKKTFIKSGRIYAKDKINFTLKSFINSWTKRNRRKVKEMSVIGFNII